MMLLRAIRSTTASPSLTAHSSAPPITSTVSESRVGLIFWTRSHASSSLNQLFMRMGSNFVRSSYGVMSMVKCVISCVISSSPFEGVSGSAAGGEDLAGLVHGHRPARLQNERGVLLDHDCRTRGRHADRQTSALV